VAKHRNTQNASTYLYWSFASNQISYYLISTILSTLTYIHAVVPLHKSCNSYSSEPLGPWIREINVGVLCCSCCTSMTQCAILHSCHLTRVWQRLTSVEIMGHPTNDVCWLALQAFRLHKEQHLCHGNEHHDMTLLMQITCVTNDWVMCGHVGSVWCKQLIALQMYHLWKGDNFNVLYLSQCTTRAL